MIVMVNQRTVNSKELDDSNRRNGLKTSFPEKDLK